MKTEYKKSLFNRIVSRVSVLVVFVSILMGPWNALASSQNDEPISRGEFIAMIAKYQPENPLFPKGHSQLSREELYIQTTQNLSQKGFKVLNGKSSYEPLEPNEFVQVSYIFTDGPPGKNLFEQKLFLKNAGIIGSADVGLTTAYDGEVYQTHQGESLLNQVRLATPIYMNDHLKTDFSAKATFTFDDGSTLTMAEDSTVNITKHIYNPDTDFRQTIVSLSKGTFRFIVTKGKASGSMFKVFTPTATAGVRGTEFIVDVDPDGRTTFIVVEGEIETSYLLPNGEERAMRFVSAGESRSISKINKAAEIKIEVKKVTPELLQSILTRTENPKNQWVQKGLSKAVARNGVQRVAMTMAKIKTKQKPDDFIIKATAKKMAKGATKDATQIAMQDATQEAVQDATQAAVKNATQAAVKNATQAAVQDATQVAMQDATQDVVLDAIQVAMQDAMLEAALDALARARGRGRR